MKNILFIHQSAELYGSDKVLLLLVTEFKKKGHHPIVVLPGKGPLLDVLVERDIQVIVAPVIKLSRKMFTLKNLSALPFQAASSMRFIDSQLQHLKIDLIYSNTLAVLLGLIYARRKKIKHIWHVHEIIEKPHIVRKIFNYLLKLNANKALVYNSFATRNFWEGEPARRQAYVVWNGLGYEPTDIPDTTINEIRSVMFRARKDDIVIALVGRINRLKGQQLLLEAFKGLQLTHSRLKLVYVGSAPENQEIYLTQLKEKITQYHLEDRVTIIPFQNKISEIWASVDIAVVPSSEPESFGLVALEAMLAKKPVIASNHGGIAEIIVHRTTGLLFTPNSVTELQQDLDELIRDEEKRALMGKNGYERAITEFTLERYVNGIEKICLAI